MERMDGTGMFAGREWTGTKGATADALMDLVAVAPAGLPRRYIDLLAFSDGGEGPLPVLPYNFCLDPVKLVIETIEGRNLDQADLEGFLIFGGNGGGEFIAFDLTDGLPWPVVMIDMVAGGESAEIIARDFDAFVDLIGIEADEE